MQGKIVRIDKKRKIVEILVGGERIAIDIDRLETGNPNLLKIGQMVECKMGTNEHGATILSFELI